jgi:hypothetical protein
LKEFDNKEPPVVKPFRMMPRKSFLELIEYDARAMFSKKSVPMISWETPG